MIVFIKKHEQSNPVKKSISILGASVVLRKRIAHFIHSLLCALSSNLVKFIVPAKKKKQVEVDGGSGVFKLPERFDFSDNLYSMKAEKLPDVQSTEAAGRKLQETQGDTAVAIGRIFSLSFLVEIEFLVRPLSKPCKVDSNRPISIKHTRTI